jgi:AcrR family transcriptional regulator
MLEKVNKLRGRPRVFNMDEALDKALQVFWNRGYESASLAELIDALGINKPSLYAAFGNKEELFKKVLAKYADDNVKFVRDAVKEPTAYKVAENFLVKAAEFLTDSKHPLGCMIVQGALSCGEGAQSVRDLLIHFRHSYEGLLTERFEKAKLDGDLPVNAMPKELAKYLALLHQGMSVQATGGATKQELIEITRIALKAWPTSQ